MASGPGEPICAFVDADDWLPADALETLYRALREAGADTAGGAHNRVETDGRQEKEPGALPAGVYGPEEIRRGIVDRLLGERMGKPGEVLNGFVWRFLFSREIIQGHNMAFAGAYLEDELFLLEYFCYARKLAMVDQPVYQYLQNPVSVTRRYLPDYMQTFQGFMKAKEDLAQRMGLGENMPLWRENSYWSGLLIAIGMSLPPATPPHWRRNAGESGASVSCRPWPGPFRPFSPRAWAGTNRLWLTWSAGGGSFCSRCCMG